MRPLFRLVLIFLLLKIIPCPASGQNSLGDAVKIDSAKKYWERQRDDSNKVNGLNELGRTLTDEGAFNNAMHIAEEALRISEKKKYKKGEADALYNMLTVLGEQSYTDRSLYPKMYGISRRALSLYEQLGDAKGIAHCHDALAGLRYNEGNYAEALQENYTALQFYEQAGDKNLIGAIYRKIAYVYDAQNNVDEALKNYQASLRFNLQAGDSVLIAGSYMNIGRMHYLKGNYPEALKMQLQGMEILKKINDTRVIPFVYENVGNIYVKQGELALAADNKAESNSKFSEALTNYLTCLKMLEEIDYTDALAQLHGLLGSLYTKLGRLDLARSYLDKSLRTSLTIGYNEQIKDSYFALAQLDSAQGNYKQAYQHYKQYITLRDSLANEESAKKSLQAKLQYEFDKKQAVAKAAQDKKDAEAKRVKNIQYFAIVALGIVVLAVAIIASIQYRNNKQRRVANALLQQEKEKVENTLVELKAAQSQLIQAEKMASLGQLTAGIAHEIQNPLNFVNNFASINKELLAEMRQEIDQGHYGEAKAIAAELESNEEKIAHHGQRADNIVKGMLQHARKSTGKKEPTDANQLVDEYLRLSYQGMRAKDKAFNAGFEMNLDETLGAVSIVRQDIGRVLLNLFNNAFYAVAEKKARLGKGFEPMVSVSTKKENNQVLISVKDNGPGIPPQIVDKVFQPFFTTKPTGEGTGLGLSLSYDIVTKGHGGELSVRSTEGEGTEFVATLPVA